LDQATVEYLAEDRKQASLEGYFTGLSADQVAGIEAIGLDMWEPYVQTIRTCRRRPPRWFSTATTS
jgi:hypothetical protein